MSEPKNTLETVRYILGEQFLCDLFDIKPEATIRSLGADSLDDVELVMAVEDEFGIEIAEEEAEKLTTVQHIVDLVDKKLKQ